MRRVRIGVKRWLIELSYVLISLAPLASCADTEPAIIPTYALLEDSAKDGKLYPLEALEEGIDVVIDDNVYGYAVKRFQTWFEIGDAELWAAVGVAPQSGVLSWDDWVNLADAVVAYNQHSTNPIWLLAVQAQRFPRTCTLMENQEVRTQWETMQPLVCTANEESGRVLLTERVFTLNQVGYQDYVVGFEYNGQVYRLGEIETRYAAVMKDANNAETQRAKLLADMQNISFAATGILPAGITYEECCKAWNLSLQKPNELNFALWQRMEEDTVR